MPAIVPIKYSIPAKKNVDPQNAGKDYMDGLSNDTDPCSMVAGNASSYKLVDYFFCPVRGVDGGIITEHNYLQKIAAPYERYVAPTYFDKVHDNRARIERISSMVNSRIKESDKYIFVNLGMAIEMFKKGYADEDFYWQKLRLLGKGKGGFFKKNEDFKSVTSESTHYRYIETLTKELGFTTYNKVKNYREISLTYSPIQQYIKVPNRILLESINTKNGDVITPKQRYKSFILAAVESYMLESNYKAQNQGVSKFDYEAREWACERYDQPEHFRVVKKKFSSSGHDCFQGRISDAMICNLFGLNDKNSKVTIDTIRKWRSINKVNGYYLTHLFIPYKDYDFSKELIKNSYTIYYGNRHTGKHKYLARIDRRIIGTVPIYTIEALRDHWSLRVHMNQYHKDNRKIIGKDRYNDDMKLKPYKSQTSKEPTIYEQLEEIVNQGVLREVWLNNSLAEKKELRQHLIQHNLPYEWLGDLGDDSLRSSSLNNNRS